MKTQHIPKIKILIKNTEGEVLFKKEISEFPITIGRKEPSTIIISNTFLSTEHCRISLKDNHFLFEDLQSTNGCFIAKKQISSLVIDESANIRIGTELFLFVSTPLPDLELEEKTEVPLNAEQENNLQQPHQPSEFSLQFNHNEMPQRQKELNSFLRSWTDQSYKSFFVSYTIFAVVSCTSFLFFVEGINFIEAGLMIFFGVIGISIVFAGIASVLACPGWIFHGLYSFKSIFLTLLIAFIPFTINKFIFLPFTLITNLGIIFKILILFSTALSSFLIIYVFFKSLLSDKWAYKISSVYFVIVNLLILLNIVSIARNHDQKNKEEIFSLSKTGILRLLPTETTTTEDAIAQLLQFDAARNPASSE